MSCDQSATQQRDQDMSAPAPPAAPTTTAACAATASAAAAASSTGGMCRSTGQASKVPRSREQWYADIRQRQAPLLAQDGRRATCSASAGAGRTMSMQQQQASMLSVQARKIRQDVCKGATISAAAWASSPGYGSAPGGGYGTAPGGGYGTAPGGYGAAPPSGYAAAPDASASLGLQSRYASRLSKAAKKSMTYSTNSKSIRSKMTTLKESRSATCSVAEEQASRAQYETLQAELTSAYAVQAESDDEDEEDQTGMAELEEEAMQVTGQRLSQVLDNPEVLDALIGKGIDRLKVEPATEDGCKVMFDMYEAFTETVTRSREAILAFWHGAKDEFHNGALTAMEKLMVGIDKEENLGLYEEQRTNHWFVYLMASKVMANCKTIDGLLRTLTLKLEQMASQDECPVCLETFEDIGKLEGNEDAANGGATALGCCHKVCTECWDHWRPMQGGGFCPLCRHEEFAVRLGYNY